MSLTLSQLFTAEFIKLFKAEVFGFIAEFEERFDTLGGVHMTWAEDRGAGESSGGCGG